MAIPASTRVVRRFFTDLDRDRVRLQAADRIVGFGFDNAFTIFGSSLVSTTCFLHSSRREHAAAIARSEDYNYK